MKCLNPVSSFSLQSSVSNLIFSLLILLTYGTIYNLHRRETLLEQECHQAPEKVLCSSPVLRLSSPVILPRSWGRTELGRVERTWEDRLERGGGFAPSHCYPTSRLAIIVPYRNSSKQLANFLEVMHPFLQRQNVEYTILVISPTENSAMPRGLLFNIGYLTSLRELPFTPNCFVFHDPSLVPERLGLAYHCSPQGITELHNPHRFKEQDDKNNRLQGRVIAMTRAQMEEVNGFSNLYTGLSGLEFEDMELRTRTKDLPVIVLPEDLTRFTRIDPAAEEDQPQESSKIEHLELLKIANITQSAHYDQLLISSAYERVDKDGVNSARHYYSVEGRVNHWSHTEVRVRTDPERMLRDGMQFIARFQHTLNTRESEAL